MKENSNIWDNVLLGRRLFAITAIVHIVLMHVAYFVLADTFQFPDILRRPPSVMLRTFAEHLDLNRSAYYLFTLSGFSFVIMHIFLVSSMKRRGPLADVGRVFAVLAGLLQALGFGRWVFLVPMFTGASTANPAEQAMQLQMLEAFHRYAGLLMGENLAFVAHGIAGFCLSLQLLREPSLPRFFGYAGLPIHLLIGLYSLEQFGGIFAALGPWNVVFQVLWLCWLLFAAYYFARSGREGARNPGMPGYAAMVLTLTAMLASTAL